MLFPKYRERYLRDAWPAVTKSLKEVRIFCSSFFRDRGRRGGKKTTAKKLTLKKKKKNPGRHRLRAQPGRRLHARAHHQEDLGPLRDRQGPRRPQAPRAVRAGRAGSKGARRRHAGRCHQDRRARAQQGEVRQAAGEAAGAQRGDAESLGTADGVLCARAG